MRSRIIRLLFVGCSFAMSLCASTVAAPFVNLDFELSTVQPTDPQVVPTAAAFPGWTARFGNNVSSTVFHDYAGAGEPIVAVYDMPAFGGSDALLQGEYMAVLGPGTDNAVTSLAQVGDIPTGTQSMTLLCAGHAGPPIVRVNGLLVSTTYLSGIPASGEVNVYGADVSAFAGQTIEIRFQSKTFIPGEDFGFRSFDDVRFSPNPIPEPGWGLCALPLIAMMMGQVKGHVDFSARTSAQPGRDPRRPIISAACRFPNDARKGLRFGRRASRIGCLPG
ncbi:MAG: hypothetical protein H7Z14_13015 [Anaerolineae bacterium]|nr:hypothetical protein [Phycisphaerae bacterium]